jgi:hypothetical protein
MSVQRFNSHSSNYTITHHLLQPGLSDGHHVNPFTMSAPSLATIAPELRNYIYSLVFHSDFAVTLGAGGDIQPGLTRTNRFFRGEALPMYFGTTTLNAHFVNNIDALLHLWQALGADLVLSMKEVRLWVSLVTFCRRSYLYVCHDPTDNHPSSRISTIS